MPSLASFTFHQGRNMFLDRGIKPSASGMRLFAKVSAASFLFRFLGISSMTPAQLINLKGQPKYSSSMFDSTNHECGELSEAPSQQVASPDPPHTSIIVPAIEDFNEDSLGGSFESDVPKMKDFESNHGKKSEVDKKSPILTENAMMLLPNLETLKVKTAEESHEEELTEKRKLKEELKAAFSNLDADI